MPQILLTHPSHGSKFALSEAEVLKDEENGWVRYTEDTPAEVAPKRKYTRRVTEQPIEQPNEAPAFLASVSEESEGA